MWELINWNPVENIIIYDIKIFLLIIIQFMIILIHFAKE